MTDGQDPKDVCWSELVPQQHESDVIVDMNLVIFDSPLLLKCAWLLLNRYMTCCQMNYSAFPASSGSGTKMESFSGRS